VPVDSPQKGWAPLLERAFESLPRTHGDTPVRELSLYLDELVLWNRRTDLTAARSAEELVDLSVADAQIIAAATVDDRGAWIDVGSGAGAPGLVLALLLPNIRVTLVEPKDRRVAFLRNVLGKLDLRRAVVERGRSDKVAPRSCDTATSRATLPPPEWLAEGARLARAAVWVLLAREEPPVLDGFRADQDVRYEWPLTGAKRRAVRYSPEHTPEVP
jgi:16S rRNA (guanine527-N7)-methyltransferase